MIDLDLVLAMKLEVDMTPEEITLKKTIEEINNALQNTTDLTERATLATNRRQAQAQLLNLLEA